MGFLILRISKLSAAAGIALISAACVAPPELADKLARQGNLAPLQIRTAQFDLRAYGRFNSPGEDLTVYVEGDGRAWITPSRPSTDPTPHNPTALRLAAADHSGNVVWMGRPCQYYGGAAARGCSAAYWTDGRYAPEIIDAYDQALSQLRRYSGAQSIQLIGYSGGGAVAALTAARRRDVSLLVTVAAVLDSKIWTSTEQLTPLRRSMDPADNVESLSNVRQVHFVGSDDDVVPSYVARSYIDKFPSDRKPLLVEMKGFDHVCCWASDWNALLKQLPRRDR